MTRDPDLVLLICAERTQAKAYVAALNSLDDLTQVRPAENLIQAQYMLERAAPQVILLDESALLPDVPPEKTVSRLIEHAPVVLAADVANADAFSFLIGSGAADIVARSGNFTHVVAGLVDRRLRLAERVAGTYAAPADSEDFGELLRHEMNNPLTGILGNAELLLSRRDRLPPQAVAQIETIASLAMRLRETIRQLSDTWESSRHQVHSA